MPDRSFADEPDLVIVDGGKGQLSTALEAMKELDVAGIPIIGLAKREEEIFVPGVSEPLLLDRGSEHSSWSSEFAMKLTVSLSPITEVFAVKRW